MKDVNEDVKALYKVGYPKMYLPLLRVWRFTRSSGNIYIYIYSFFIHVLKFGLAVRNLYLGIFLEIQKQFIFFHHEEVRAIYYITNIMKISLKPHGLFYPNLLIKAFIRTLNNADCLMVCVIWTTGIIKITYM